MKREKQLENAAKEALAALRKHDAWHEQNDEHGGYPDSELSNDTTNAIIALRNLVETK